MMKYKNISAPVEDVDVEKGIVTLYASAFGNVDSDGDVIQKGAWTKSIQERGPQSSKPRIKHLWMHDMMNPIGIPMSMEEDGFGLIVQSKVSDVRNGDYLKLYRDGVITEHSVGFEVIKTGESRNDITEAKLWEYSSVTWGANENTPVVGMKAQFTPERAEQLNNRLDNLTKALRNGGYTDDTFRLIENQLDIIKNEIRSLAKQDEPDNSTPKNAEPNINLLEIWKNL